MVAVACAGSLTGLLLMSLVVLLVYCYRGYQRARRRLLGIKRGGGMVGEEDEQIELMPARFSIDGGESMLLAVDVDRCRSVNAVKQTLCDAFADVAGEKLQPSSVRVEFDDEADGFTLLEPNALADGRLRSARSLHVTGRASGAGGTRWGRA
jgi:hypothetical protein